MIDAATIHAHWPDYLVGAHHNIVFCACGAEFRSDDTEGDVDVQWADHVAHEVNGRARLLADRATLDAQATVWEDGHAGPRKPRP